MAREITQRELRNDSGEIMRRLDEGESFIVTRNGVPVGELTPLRRHRFVAAEAAVALFRTAPPVDYGQLGAYLAESRGLPTVEIRTPYHSTWLDNTKAKLLLAWRPRYDLERLVKEAWSYERDPDEPRVVWYPG